MPTTCLGVKNQSGNDFKNIKIKNSNNITVTIFRLFIKINI